MKSRGARTSEAHTITIPTGVKVVDKNHSRNPQQTREDGEWKILHRGKNLLKVGHCTVC